MNNKAVKVIAISVAILLSIFGLGYGIFNHYYSKLNYVEIENQTNDITQDEIDSIIKEEQIEDATDSPQEEIDKIDQSMENMNKYDVISDEDVINILCVGIDTRQKGKNSRSDAMIIISLNTEKKTITLTSVLRDIYVDIPGYNKNKLNAAMAFGNVSLLKETIEQNFKIKIDRYMIVDFFSFVDIIDAVGGVDLEVTKDEQKYINLYLGEINKLLGDSADTNQLKDYGNVKLNGRQALSYARIRYIGTDFGRTERQRKVMLAAFDKVKDSNFIVLSELLDKTLPYITTDLTQNEILGLLVDLSEYKNYTLSSNCIPYKNTYTFCTINKMSVIGIDFEKNIEMFNRDIYGIEIENSKPNAADVIN